jgi:hypothetical protein
LAGKPEATTLLGKVPKQGRLMSNPDSAMQAAAPDPDITTPVEADPDIETDPIDSPDDKPSK